MAGSGGPSEAAGGRWQLPVAIALAVLSVAATLVVVFSMRPAASTRIEILPPPPTATAEPTATPSPWRVYVTGAVLHPGVVEVAAGARVEDAVNMAGGATSEANMDAINLAAGLVDGQHVRVPVVGEVVSEERDAAPVGRLNINQATAEELEELPGIGEVTAAKIVGYRQEHGPFASIEEIMDVPGIGEVKFSGFKDLITVGP